MLSPIRLFLRLRATTSFHFQLCATILFHSMQPVMSPYIRYLLVSGGGGTWIKRYREGVGTGISGVFEGTGIVFWSEGTGNFVIFDNFLLLIYYT